MQTTYRHSSVYEYSIYAHSILLIAIIHTFSPNERTILVLMKTMFVIIDIHGAVHRNIIPIVKPTICTNVSNVFYFGMTLYMFRTVFPSIIRSSTLYIQQQVSVWLLCVQC